MKPICVPCQRFYRCAKNDFPFIEGMPINGRREQWAPYKLWLGDKWRCEGCGHEIVVGVAREPVGEHYQSDFARRVEQFAPALQVNDC